MSLEEKWCPRCKITQPHSSFGRNKARADGLQQYCRPCKNAGHRAWRKTETGWRVHRNDDLKRTYGITIEDYEAMHEAQGGLCAICHQLDASGKALAVDHHHGSGQVRKLLCGHCNRGLGYFREDPGLLSAAIKYLGGEDVAA